MRLKTPFLFIIAILGIGLLTFASSVMVSAAPLDAACEADPSATICQDTPNNDPGAIIKVIVNSLLFLLGAVSVFAIIIGGITYTTSAGESGHVTKAKNTILYAVIGLVVAFLAFAIVNYVVNLF